MLSNNKSAAQELESVLEEVNALDGLTDQELAEVMTQDKILNIKKSMNPYGRTIEGSNAVLNFSITHIQQEYRDHMLMITMGAFLHRMCDEYGVPEGFPIHTVYECLDNPSLLDPPPEVVKKNIPSIMQEFAINKENFEKRKIIKAFLEEVLQFNPEEHVRSMYRPNRTDLTRKPVTTNAAKLAIQNLKRTDKEFKNKEEEYEDQSKKFKIVKKKLLNPKTGKTRIVEKKVPIEDDPEVVRRNTKPLKDVSTKRVVENINGKEVVHQDPNATFNAREYIPPADTMHRFKIYLKENYEQMREATNDLIGWKSDFELAINPYSWHTGEDAEEKAYEFRKKHADEVITEVFPAYSGKWNFFDSFKKQRESTNFFNKDTVILEEMTKEIERGERLGQDMMKKRVLKAKEKNIIETGPDAEGFKKWQAQNTELKKLGAQHVTGGVDEDCPDDAVQVDVWRLGKTGTQLAKERFFTKSEAPLHMKSEQDKEKLEKNKKE